MLFLLCCLPALAVVELALEGEPPAIIEEVYLRDGESFLAVDDVLQPLGLSGKWDAVDHVYRIRSPRGTATISPGSSFLKLGERFIPLKNKPRFIDSRLRVSELFVTKHLSDLVGERLYYRNLDPNSGSIEKGGSALDRLFSFLLRKKKPAGGPILRAVAIDPGHGGHDPGAIGINGTKEKDVTLAVAKHLQRLIDMQLGIPIYLSRDDDYGLTTEERLKPATHPDVDALILLHAQSAVDYKPQGIYIYVRRTETLPGQLVKTDDKDSLKLAKSLSSALRDAGLNVHAVSEAPLFPLGQGDLPTVLVEMGYLTNQADKMLLNEEEGQKKLAKALYSGLESFGQGRTRENAGGNR
jgi:N-acetylmuramoyl-L-alanine amidase